MFAKAAIKKGLSVARVCANQNAASQLLLSLADLRRLIGARLG